MKCIIFSGTYTEAMDAFNKWAKGKTLNREVLIHEQAMWTLHTGVRDTLLIIVYYPEDIGWEKTEPTLTVPVHKEPEEHIKLEEAEVAQ